MKRTTTLMTGVATAALTVTTALPAFAAEKWDMPMAYSASNFHSENGVEFANCVTEGTAGEIEITVHPGQNACKAPAPVVSGRWTVLQRVPWVREAVVKRADDWCRGITRSIGSHCNRPITMSFSWLMNL